MWKNLTKDGKTQAMIVPTGMIIAKTDFSFNESSNPSVAMVFVPFGAADAKIWLSKINPGGRDD